MGGLPRVLCSYRRSLDLKGCGSGDARDRCGSLQGRTPSADAGRGGTPGHQGVPDTKDACQGRRDERVYSADAYHRPNRRDGERNADGEIIPPCRGHQCL